MPINFVVSGIRLAAGALMIAVLTSCVTRSEYVNLTYPPIKQTEHRDKEPVDKALPPLRVGSLMINVADQRLNQARIGKINGGLSGAFKTPILTDDNVALWVHDAVVFELTAIGINTVIGGESSNGEESVLNVALVELVSGCYALGCSAVLHLTTKLISPDGESRETSQTGREGSTGFGFSFLPYVERALSRSLREAIQLTITELRLRPTKPSSASE